MFQKALVKYRDLIQKPLDYRKYILSKALQDFLSFAKTSSSKPNFTGNFKVMTFARKR